MLKSSAELLRSYVDIVDEAVRMAFTRNRGDGKDDAVRPANQAERDQLAQAARQSRAYNQQMKAYATQPTDVPGEDDIDPATAIARGRGRQSGNIMRTDSFGAEVPSGPRVAPAAAPDYPWTARAVDTKDPSIQWGSQVGPRNGKPGAVKKPQI